MDKNLDSAERRAVQYWFADGLAELSGGVICLVLAIYFTATELIREPKWGNLILFAIACVMAFGVRWLMQRIRLRTTYPRSGYVAPKSGWEDRRLLVVTVCFTLMLLVGMVYLVSRQPTSVEWTTVVGGVIFAFIFGMAGFETRLARFIYLAICCLLLGVVLALSGLGNFWGVAVLALVAGAVLIGFGSVTRAVYLRQTRAILEADDER